MSTIEEDKEPAKDRGESITLMEPMVISEGSRHRPALTDLALELAQKSAGFRRSLPESLLASLADLVRSMNCYYSNLIVMLLYFFAPWTAVNLVDYFIVRKGHYAIKEIFNPDGLYGDIQEGHLSSAMVHLANISYRLGEQVPFSAQQKSLGDDPTAYETFARLEEHLSQGNGLKLDGMQYRLGRTLAFDPQAERFTDNADANALLTRNYRAPFAVPDKV